MKRFLAVFLLMSAAAAAGASSDRAFEDTQRAIDDVLWYFRLGDVAKIEKYEIASSKPRRGSAGAVVFPVYVFSPKHLAGKAPLLVFVHGGVHGRLTSNYAHILREAIERGFVIVSPEYRGSIGHGADLYDPIDLGGAEIDDTHDARNWAVESLPFVDPARVGIVGWSRGGYHALMNVLLWPDDYKAAYAGVPVSYATNATRSFTALALRLKARLLIHTTTNDEAAHLRELDTIVAALEAAGKPFELERHENAPGGHQFNRIDTKLARESRADVWKFLARALTTN